MGRKKFISFYLRREEREAERNSLAMTYDLRQKSKDAEQKRQQRRARESPAVNPERVNKDVWGCILSFLTIESAFRLTTMVAKRPDLWYLKAGVTTPDQMESIQSMWEWVYLSRNLTNSAIVATSLEPAVLRSSSRLLLTSDRKRLLVVSEGNVGDYSRIDWRNACRVAERGENFKVYVRVRLFNKREIEINKRRKLPFLVPTIQMWRKGNLHKVSLLDIASAEEQFLTAHSDSQTSCDEIGSPSRCDSTSKLLNYTQERETFDVDHGFWSMPEEQWPLETSSWQRHAKLGGDLSFSSQLDLYEKIGRPACTALLNGFNTCIMCYGQTGAGKTFTTFGLPPDQQGLAMRFTTDLFDRLSTWYQDTQVQEERKLISGFPANLRVEATFFEIYNERVRDLFDRKAKLGISVAPKIRQHPINGVYIEGLIHKKVESADRLHRWIERGQMERMVACTKMSSTSSRSHAVLQLSFERWGADGLFTSSKIDFVDPAGSEKIKCSAAVGNFLTEAKNIGLSLSTFRRVIDTLIDNQMQHSKRKKRIPPFRESVLTYYLSDHFSGSSYFHLIACTSPHSANVDDTLGTIRYASRFSNLSGHPKSRTERCETLLSALKDEQKYLQAEIQKANVSDIFRESISLQLPRYEEEIKKHEEALSTFDS